MDVAGSNGTSPNPRIAVNGSDDRGVRIAAGATDRALDDVISTVGASAAPGRLQ